MIRCMPRDMDAEYGTENVWPVLDKAAKYGVTGDLVRAIEPHSEADPVALLLQTLTFAGNAIGTNPYFLVESTKHGANLFGLLVGPTSGGRKGTSEDRIRAALEVAAKDWATARIKTGLSSGEGFIKEVRDKIEKWDAKERVYEIVDPGVTDKRLLVIENEFAGVLTVCDRHGNTLSKHIRNAWDGKALGTMVVNSPLTATGHHISIVGHITMHELRACLTRTDMANGFANRFLFALVKRSKFLPHGGNLDETKIAEIVNQSKLEEILKNARTIGRVEMTETAKKMWEGVYEELAKERNGLLGSITARATAQVVRLALIYALLDSRVWIDKQHLEAALAVWDFCEASAAYIFSDSLGDPVADEIYRALRAAGSGGMTRTAISNIFGRNKAGERIGAALRLLAAHGKARMEMVETGGRAAEVWFAR